MIDGLAGKKVLIVGASSGIGRAVAIEAAQNGADIAVVARRADKLETLVAEAEGGTIIVADISKPTDCTRIAEEAAAALGTIDMVVIAAGMARLRKLERLDAEDWASILNTNLVGVNMAISALLPHVAESGIVAAMSSESAGRPFYGLGAYAASKSALEDTMRAWRVERPDRRFVTLVIGSTVGTDFPADFENEAMQEAFPFWAAQGNANSAYMEPDGVALVTMSALGSLLSAPGVGIESIVLRSPAPMGASVESIQAPVDDGRS